MSDLPNKWYALTGHEYISGCTTPVFSNTAATDAANFVRVIDNTLQEISFSTKAGVEEYLTDLGFENANNSSDPDLWMATTPIFVWVRMYDYIRIATLRVIA